jgi:hypothetical protein
VLGESLVAFADSERALVLAVEDFQPSSKPDWVVRPLPFAKQGEREFSPERRARLRVSLDGTTEEFWLAAPVGQSLPDERRRVVAGDRQLEITLAHDYVDLGFEVFLHDFRRKLDPGTNWDAYYGSLVDIREVKDGEEDQDATAHRDDEHGPGTAEEPSAERTRPEDERRLLAENLLITMNEPADIRDPQSGRSYRLFQASFQKPWRPGDEVYRHLPGDGKPRAQVYRSVLSANSDPGRGLKYAGSALVCVGILIMYYMRAYFFKRRATG